MALLRPTVRAMAWTPFLIAAALGIGIVAVPASTGLKLTSYDVANLLRFAVVFAGLGVAFLLDDPAVRSTSVVPTPRVVRQAVRFAVAVPVLVAWWSAVWWTTTAGAEPRVAPTWMLRGLTVEAAATGVVALGLASTALRRLPDGGAGVVASPALLILVAATALLPPSVSLLVPPGDRPDAGRWDTAHRWWWVLIVGAGIAVLWTSRDLTSRRIGRRIDETESQTQPTPVRPGQLA